MKKTNLFLFWILVVIVNLCSCSSIKSVKEHTQTTSEYVTTTITKTTTKITTKTTTSITTQITIIGTVTTLSTEPITTTEIITEPIITDVTTEIDLYDALLIRDKVIPLTFDVVRQSIIDNCDVLYPTGYVFNANTENEYIEPPENVYQNTVLFGHNYKSFSVLSSLTVGETFDIDVHGQQTTYEIQRSEDTYLNAECTNAYFYSDNLDVLFVDYGYPALIMITCSDRGRWIVVAKPI